MQADYFVGHLSLREADAELSAAQPGDFLVRFASTHCNALALAFVDANGRRVHMTIRANANHGSDASDDSMPSTYTLSDTLDGLSGFDSVGELVVRHSTQLRNAHRCWLPNPYTVAISSNATSSTLPTWFMGDVTSEEAQILLDGTPTGTFMVRFSSSGANATG